MDNHENKIAILSFYTFTNINDPAILQPQILLRAKKKFIYGTVLVAPEGLNGSISCKEEDLHYLIEEMRKLTGAKEISVKVNYCDKQPFTKVKVKLKKEIVALKYSDLDVENLKGEYIETKDWDDLSKGRMLSQLILAIIMKLKLVHLKDLLTLKQKRSENFQNGPNKI